MANYIIPSLGKALDIIDFIVKNQGTGFNEIKETFKINVATLSRILNQLQESGYIYKCPGKRYYAGYKLAMMDVGNSMFKLLIDSTYPLLSHISDKYCVTIMLIGFMSDNMVVLKRYLNENNLGMMNEGSVLKDYQHYFWGIFYLMTQTKDVTNRLLAYSEKNPEYSVRPNKELMEDYFKQGQEKGYITDYGRILPKATRIAIPIVASKNVTLGAIAIGSFTHLLDNINTIQLIDDIRKVCDTVKKNWPK